MKTILLILLVAIQAHGFEPFEHYTPFDLKKPFQVECPQAERVTIAEALNQWSRALDNCLVWSFVDQITVSSDLNIIAVTEYQSNNSAAAEGGIDWNGNGYVHIDPVKSQDILLPICLHEVGHVLGLNHTSVPINVYLYDDPVMEAVLRASYSSLHYDDISGVRFIYDMSAISNELKVRFYLLKSVIQVEVSSKSRAHLFWNHSTFTYTSGFSVLTTPRMKRNYSISVVSRGFITQEFVFVNSTTYLDPITGRKVKIKKEPMKHDTSSVENSPGYAR